MGRRFSRGSSWQAYPLVGAVPLLLTLGTLVVADVGHGVLPRYDSCPGRSFSCFMRHLSFGICTKGEVKNKNRYTNNTQSSSAFCLCTCWSQKYICAPWRSRLAGELYLRYGCAKCPFWTLSTSVTPRGIPRLDNIRL